jgi:hypothetical protein
MEQSVRCEIAVPGSGSTPTACWYTTAWSVVCSPALLAAAGEPDIVEQLKQGYAADGKTWKVHADGYNFLPFFKGEAKKGPRDEIFYFGRAAVRWSDWQMSFATEDGNIAKALRNVPTWPVITNLRADPYERASSQSAMYIRWYTENIWLFIPVQQMFLTTLPEFPFQPGSSPNVAGISYNSVRAIQTSKRLNELESLRPSPH